jgi:hypothetical protein
VVGCWSWIPTQRKPALSCTTGAQLHAIRFPSPWLRRELAAVGERSFASRDEDLLRAGDEGASGGYALELRTEELTFPRANICPRGSPMQASPVSAQAQGHQRGPCDET